MAEGDPLPDADEVARWIKPKLLGKDDDGNVMVDDLGRPTHVFPEAFELRPDEEGLSLTWLQPFGATRAEHLPLAAQAVRNTTNSGKLPAKSAFAIGRVDSIKQAGLDANVKLRIIEDAIDGNAGHAEIRRYPAEMGSLQNVLANEVFAERHLYGVLSQPGWAG